MSRSKTARRKQKRRTMRKPRASLRITNNNLNLNVDPDLYWNLMNFYYEQADMKREREVKEKMDAVPKDTFRFVVRRWDTETYSSFDYKNTTTRLRKRGDTRELPIRAMDFLEMFPEGQEHNNRGVVELKILYKGIEPSESYFCFIRSIPNPSLGYEYYNNYYNLSTPRHVWAVYFMPPENFFKYDDEYAYPEPTRTIMFWRSMIAFVRDLPHLKEKAAKEESAVLTWRDAIRRHQRRVVEPVVAKYMKSSKQVVPENVEGVIRSFI